jgi:hypothetical protein
MRKFATLTLALLAGLAMVVIVPSASAAKHCRPVHNPYPNTRYEGVDLTRIRAVGVTCHRARHVARRAHRKGLRMTTPPSGVLHYGWRAWRVRGDLRPSHDRFRAKHRDNRVRWRF